MALMSGDGSLTARQRDVVALVRRGLSNAEIAGELGISEDGVKAHLSRLYLRFDVTNRVALLAALDDRAASARTPASTLGALRAIAGESRRLSEGIADAGSAPISARLRQARDALASVDAALDLVRDLPAETTGPVLEALRKRLAAAVAAIDEVSAGSGASGSVRAL